MTSIQIDRTDGLAAATAVKGPCRVATTANISLLGLQTIDGVALAVDDRVLVKDQADATENGVYVVDTGPWRRAKDFSGNRDVRKGTRVWVTDGAVRAETDFLVTNENPIVIGITELAFVAASAPIGDGDVGALQISDDPMEWDAIAAKLRILGKTDTNLWFNADDGDDDTGDGTLANPYRTYDRAKEDMPILVNGRTTIWGGGAVTDASRSPLTMIRPALFYIDKLKIGQRTDAPGGDMIGGLVIKHEPTYPALILQPGATYTRGVYATGHVGSVGLQNFTIDAQAGAESGIVSHRGMYVHVSDVDVDGNGTLTFGLIAEAGGIMEALVMVIHHCAIGVQSYQGSTVQLSLSSSIHDCSSQGISVPNGGYVGLTTGSTCSSGVLLQAGGRLDLAGISSSRVTVSGALQARGGDITAAFADLTGTVTTYPGSRVNGGAVGWSNQWLDYGGDLYLPGCKSFVAPATQSAVAFPMIFLGDAKNLFVETTFEIRNNSGTLISEGLGADTLNISTNNQVITGAVIRGRNNVVYLTAAAARSGCEFPANMGSSRLASTPVPFGTVLYALAGSSLGSNTIEIVNGSTGDIPGGAITINTAAGSYAGVVGIMGPAGKWIISAFGAVR